ncbi:MAG TPA: HepT-like ribonuclease domain-containing protein, partial [Tepidisphaeraceae bacterium]
QSRTDYEQNEMLRLAVERCIEIIGEAARRVPPAFRDANPQIAWRPIMATRHILAHDYDAVNNDTVWRIVIDHLPPLIEQLRPLIPPEPTIG